ncbi:hypothetical protein DFQ28_010919 [Apophysomyces sp. BC1034]|nr:hypothetical protein DFQ29_004234 [Apophysomyces sp. BC1021]KAG0191805.1 hypothetical protein DFQ28_010919 [Apophysomyces sp. BC1034]
MTPASAAVPPDQNRATRNLDVKPDALSSPLPPPPPKASNIVDPVGPSIKAGDGEKQGSEKAKLSLPTADTWPIQVRLSLNAQDVGLSIPVSAPFMTIAGLRQMLQPHIDTSQPTRIKFIYLGRILADSLLIVPATVPTPKQNCVRIQKDSVIQAMVSRVQ